jgi:hypothetical protein
MQRRPSVDGSPPDSGSEREDAEQFKGEPGDPEMAERRAARERRLDRARNAMQFKWLLRALRERLRRK